MMTGGAVRTEGAVTRPVWLRALLQVVLAAVLSLVAPLLGVLEAPLVVPLHRLAIHAGADKAGLLALIALQGAIPYFLTGALTALLTWLVVRKPWDALGASGLQAALILALGVMMCPPAAGVSQQPRWWWPVLVTVEVVGVLAGTAATGWWLQRRERQPQAEGADNSAFLP